jgi:hypothetical protein
MDREMDSDQLIMRFCLLNLSSSKTSLFSFLLLVLLCLPTYGGLRRKCGTINKPREEAAKEGQEEEPENTLCPVWIIEAAHKVFVALTIHLSDEILQRLNAII